MKKLGFGVMRPPLLDKKDNSSIDIELLKKMVDVFLERGFTYFDTAWMYCGFESENAVRKALTSRYPRDKYTVATKLHSNFFDSLEGRDEIFSKQLEKCGVEYFDYYLLHDVNRHSVVKYEEFDCFEWLKQKKEAGLAKHIGFSFHDSPAKLDEYLTKYPFVDFVQIQLNYLDWNGPKVRSGGCYEVAVKHGKPVVVMEPVRGGLLAQVPENVSEVLKKADPEASAASWAIRFAAGLENVMVVLSGMSDMEQVLDNTYTVGEREILSEGEREMLLECAELIRNHVAVPCTCCSYCTDGCPAGIRIPEVFSLYNRAMTGDGVRDKYNETVKDSGKASDCVGCGQCEGVCPQHLPIREIMEKISEKFD